VKEVTHEEQEREAWRAGVVTRMHISARNGATQLCIFEQWIAPDAGAPAHHHPVEEVLTVIAGEAELWIADERIVLAGGHSLIVPAHAQHGFRNCGSTPLHMRGILASPVFEAIIEGELMRRWEAEDQPTPT